MPKSHRCRLLIDADPALFLASGVGVASRTLISSLCAMRPDISVTALLSKDAPVTPWLKQSLECQSLTILRLHRTKRERNLTELFSCPAVPMAIARSFDAVLYLYPRLPLKACVRQFMIVHDLSSIRCPSIASIAWHGRYLLRRGLQASAQAQVKFIAISEFTRLDLAEYVGIRPENIACMQWAIDPVSPTSNEILNAVKKHGVSEHYLFWCGEPTPRKDVATLLRAYADLYRKLGSQAPQVVIAGALGRSSPEITSLVHSLGISAHVKILGFVEKPELRALMAGAVAFVFPSLYEGFGLPVLEAMSMGTIALVSDRSALPEIGGPSAITFRAGDASDLACKLVDLLATPKARLDAIRVESRAWAGTFTQSRMCNQFDAVL